MNPDEIKSLAVKVTLIALTALATSLHQNLGADNAAAIATDIVDLGALIYGVYLHWGMKKVPQDAVVQK